MPITAFFKDGLLARGSAEEVAAIVRTLPPTSCSSDILAFDDESGRQIDLPLNDIAVTPARSRGRPSLGVSAREVTLLPRHWEWLAAQPGGASAALRRLVEEARKRGRSRRECQDAAYRFLTVMTGDRPGYEEAMRALYADDRQRFEELAGAWPPAIRDHGCALAWPEDAGVAMAPA
jgi:uncharacterized protein